MAESVERCRRPGAGEVVLVPASLVPPHGGPLLGMSPLAALVRDRAAEVERRDFLNSR
ncbi:hypothetical protein [Actinomadura nitritigenes]|uniref:hypothetical protein n=1 Tax=Actinomadura nitritigenes TaxID=134602 RepID=UPI003D8ADFF5